MEAQESQQRKQDPTEASAAAQQPIRPFQYVEADFIRRISLVTACVWLSVMVMRLIAAARRTFVKGERR